MLNLPAGVAATLTIPYVDGTGARVTPTGILVTVVDQDGAVMHGPVPVNPAGESALTFTVPAAANTLPAGDTIGFRTIEVDLDTAAGPVALSQGYIVRSALQLQPLVNSFQTFERALMTAADMLRLDDFNTASDEAKRAALLEAFQRLTRLGYFVRPDGDDDDWRERIVGHSERVVPREWPVMTQERWQSFPARFRKALFKAQVQQANALLSSGDADEARRMGLLSKTTGESSAMFRSGKPLDLPVSREALDHLGGFVELRLAIGR